jgi:hypothetical protein
MEDAKDTEQYKHKSFRSGEVTVEMKKVYLLIYKI